MNSKNIYLLVCLEITDETPNAQQVTEDLVNKTVENLDYTFVSKTDNVKIQHTEIIETYLSYPGF